LHPSRWLRHLDFQCSSWRQACCAWLLAIAVPLAYSLITRHVWEDFYITFRFSRNLVEGKGLVYQDAERVHGFTSPIGVLLPAGALWLTGGADRALWIFRIISILAFAAGCRFLWKAYAAEYSGGVPVLFLVLLYALDAKSVAFSTNGMETAFVLFGFGWSLRLLQRGDPLDWMARGLCWAGFMWTRPDGCVYILSLALAELAFAKVSRIVLLRSLVRSASIAAIIYLPWFVWAWLYYKSPIPNTVRAKAPIEYLAYLSDTAHALPQYFAERAGAVFTPIYAQTFGGWPGWTGPASNALSLFAACYWLFPVADRFGRACSLVFAILLVYAIAISEFYPWYIPPLTLCGNATVVSALARVWTATSKRSVRIACASVLAGWSAASAYLLAMMTWQMYVQQNLIEDQQRIPLGLWLRDHVGPGERTYVECLGYLGYFSDANMIDWPGLVTPKVVELRRRGYDLHTVVPELQPEWLVLRPADARAVIQLPGMARRYSLEREFNVRSELSRYSPLLPGKGYLEIDAWFLVFHKNPRST
jgi:hypothetical protein